MDQRRDLFVQFHGWYESGEFIHLAMEYVQHGDLAQYLKDFGPKAMKEASEITKQLLEGLAVLHGRQICHRDLKPQIGSSFPGNLIFPTPPYGLLIELQNVLIASPSPIRVKLADFGVSKCTIGTNLYTKIGTTGYMAPELLRLSQILQPEAGYTYAVDMWALGCIVYQLLTFQFPFQKTPSSTTILELEDYTGVATTTPMVETDMNLSHQFCSGSIPLPTQALEKSQVSSQGVRFVKRLLVANPTSRISAADGLSHRWFFNYPPILDQEGSSAVLRDQLNSIGVDISLDTAEKLIEECRQRWGVDLESQLPPEKIKDVEIPLCAAVSNRYTLIARCY